MTTRLTVLVTGASSGIGRATATEFARQGHLVFAAARREEVLAGLAAASPNIQPVGLDVTDEGSVHRAWAKIEAATGGAGVDVLVNCAGFALTGPVEILGGPAVQRQFATNVFGLLTVTRAVLPAMRARKSGRIINISSLVGRATFPGIRRHQVRRRGAVRRPAPGGSRVRHQGHHHRAGVRRHQHRRDRRRQRRCRPADPAGIRRHGSPRIEVPRRPDRQGHRRRTGRRHHREGRPAAQPAAPLRRARQRQAADSPADIAARQARRPGQAARACRYLTTTRRKPRWFRLPTALLPALPASPPN
jgi:hypothetical protein